MTAQTPPMELLKKQRRNPIPKDAIEVQLKKELERCRLIQPGWQPLASADLQNDEICGELRIKLRQLQECVLVCRISCSVISLPLACNSLGRVSSLFILLCVMRVRAFVWQSWRPQRRFVEATAGSC